MLASDDSSGAGITETATFCKLNDNKRPGLVPANPNGPDQVCPDDLTMGVDEVTDASPLTWYVRIEFDELLDTNVEELIPILDSNNQPTGTYSGSLATTQPVTLTCGGTPVPYDGYYSPSGNAFTWPLGPSLYIQPLDQTTVATSTECEITVKTTVLDKDGNQVPSTEVGPYKFTIAAMALVGESEGAPTDPPTDPTMPEVDDATVPEVLTFNANVDPTSLTPSEVKIVDLGDATTTDCTATTGTAKVAVVVVDPMDPTSFDVSEAGQGGGFEVGRTISITFAAGADVKDAAGGVGPLPAPADLTMCFQTM